MTDREVMRMEQMGLYLVLLCVVTAVLSLVTLHRMRKISKQLKELAEKEERVLTLLARRPEEKANEQTTEQPAETYSPEELIDAVLGEVFP